jgi:hypothetical protein
MIERSSMDDGAITTFTVTGPVTYEELIATIESAYGSIGLAVLWDVTDGSFASMDQARIRTIAQRVAGIRKGGYTAYIGAGLLEFGILRTYEAYAEMSGATHQVAVFRTREEGVEWLRSRLSQDDAVAPAP